MDKGDKVRVSAPGHAHDGMEGEIYDVVEGSTGVLFADVSFGDQGTGRYSEEQLEIA